MRIKTKLLLAFGSILLLSVLLVILTISAINSILDLRELRSVVDRTHIMVLNTDLHLKDFANRGFKDDQFLQTGESKLIKSFNGTMDSVKVDLQMLSDLKYFEDPESDHFLTELKEHVDNYHILFNDLVELYKIRGFQDYGLEGKLREAIHTVENSTYNFNAADMLMLRRHEKDFFLRKDMKYLNKFNTAVVDFKNDIGNTNNSDFEKNDIIASLGMYQSLFNEIVKLEENIGLSNSVGVLGKINDEAALVEGDILKLTNHIQYKTDSLTSKSIMLIVALFAGQLVVGLLLVLVYSGLITKSIKEIKDAMVDLSNGVFPDDLKTRSNDELAETKKALNQLVERIKTAVNFARSLGKGNLKIKYDDRFNNDVLASSIIDMQEQLIDSEQKQSLINWSNEGLAKFTEILKNESDNIQALGDDIVSQMTKYLMANQGALYIIREDEDIYRIATYAYEKKRFVEEKLNAGQGLVGQAILEGETIYVTDIPESYVKITSGLGAATPSCVLIVPLKIREEIVGALELASFSEFAKHEIEFVENVADNIANIIASKQSSENMKNLVHEAEQQTEKLSERESELLLLREELEGYKEERRRKAEMAENI